MSHKTKPLKTFEHCLAKLGSIYVSAVLRSPDVADHRYPRYKDINSNIYNIQITQTTSSKQANSSSPTKHHDCNLNTSYRSNDGRYTHASPNSDLHSTHHHPLNSLTMRKLPIPHRLCKPPPFTPSSLHTTNLFSPSKQYKHQLNHLAAENAAINLKLCSLEQENRRDRLNDSASPEQRSAEPRSAEPRVEVQEETKEMMVKKAKERKRMLRWQLDCIREGMEALKAEMEWVKKEVDVLGQ
jgi:hypothetical protein